MLREREPEGLNVTRAFLAHLEGLNRALAAKFSEWLSADAVVPSAAQSDDDDDGLRARRRAEDGAVSTLDTRLETPAQLRARQPVREADVEQWSLRNVQKSMTAKSKLVGFKLATSQSASWNYSSTTR